MILTSQSLGQCRLDETRRSLAFRHSIQAGSDRTLALDLQFQKDAAFVSRRGPVPTFTRASQGWCVNSSGIIVPAAVNVPRPDYDPTTLVSLGIKNEPQSTNLCLWSEDLTNAAWFALETTASANQGVAPDGAATADIVAETTVNSIHYRRMAAANITSGTAYTASIWVKKGTGATAPDWIGFALPAAGFSTAQFVSFNVTTGAFGLSAGTMTYTAKQYPNGFWRVTCTATAGATGAFGYMFVVFTNNTNVSTSPTYAGQTTSNVFAWGGQFEALNYATSYIPTTSAAVVRSADLFSYTGGAFSGFWNASEGTLVFQGMKAALQSGSPTYIQVDDGTTNNRHLLYKEAGGETYSVTAGGVAQAFLGNVTAAAANTAFGMAIRYKANDFALSLSGGAASTDVSGSVPTVNQMTIGSRLGSAFMSGWIRSVQYYNRIATNAQLQSRSTPT